MRTSLLLLASCTFLAALLAGCGGSSGGGEPGPDASDQTEPPKFEMGAAAGEVVLDEYSEVRQEVILTSETGVSLQFAVGAEMYVRTPGAAPLEGTIKVGFDEGGGIKRPVGSVPLSGIVRPYVLVEDELVSATFEDVYLLIELYDGVGPGHFETLQFGRGDHHITGPKPGTTDPASGLIESYGNIIPQNPYGPEAVYLDGTGPVGIVFVPAATSNLVLPVTPFTPPPGTPLRTRTLDVSGEDPAFRRLLANVARTHETWQILSGYWAGLYEPPLFTQGMNAATSTNLAGETWEHIFSSPALNSVERTITVRSYFSNRLNFQAGLATIDLEEHAEVFEDAEGGSLEEDDPDGLFAGFVWIELSGDLDPQGNEAEDLDRLEDDFDLLRDLAPPEGKKLLMKRLYRWYPGSSYSVALAMDRHYASVLGLAEELPEDWVWEVGDRLLRIDASTWLSDFQLGTEGWEGAHDGGPYGQVYWHKGSMVLDGADEPGSEPEEEDPQPNAWISKTFHLPAQFTTLEFRTSAHKANGPSDSALRVRLVDNNGESHTLLDWEVLAGSEDGRLSWVTRTASIEDFAGTTVTIYFEQDDDGDGANEQRWLDDIVLY